MGEGKSHGGYLLIMLVPGLQCFIMYLSFVLDLKELRRVTFLTLLNA